LKAWDIWDVINVKSHELQVVRSIVARATADLNETPQHNECDFRIKKEKMGNIKEKITDTIIQGKK
jgi:hypothetical protein